MARLFKRKNDLIFLTLKCQTSYFECPKWSLSCTLKVETKVSSWPINYIFMFFECMISLCSVLLSLLLKVIYSVQQYYVQSSIKSSLYSVNKSKSTTHSFFQLVALGWEVAKPKDMLGLPQGRLWPHPPPHIDGGRISIRAKAYPFSVNGQVWVVKRPPSPPLSWCCTILHVELDICCKERLG